MTDIIQEIFDKIQYLETEQYKNMTVTAINIPDNNIDLMPLEIGLNMGLVEITELDEQGIVGEVKVTNKAVTPLLLLDGEEIIGSKQNRIINSTIIIPPQSEKNIPVSCVEEGRWSYKSKKFNYSDHMATSRVRRNKQESVTQSLRAQNNYKSNQARVWDNIRDTINNLDITSETNALHDTYKQRITTIEEYKKAFKTQDKQNGIIVYINGQLAGLEIIYNKTRYNQYHEKIIESYIMDAIQTTEENNTNEITQEQLIQKIIETPRENYNPIGLGNDYRLEDDEIIGSIITYEEKLINASIFKKTEENII
ncbi:DUF6569 family protein [Methanosphaera sp. ISO3-F5]|uniref:ARPP-1 family domain-containing protein n=1 Tax=Methanosphaera sp. ISO3-F5 TaxID=1452353 RepID=UPI002B262FE3|nr:DUF6569 family protein [Methanosphaera sp. ISO3-F5]WQH63768.1 hypothetical protein PXD04_08695 [Methanosphaera sp. ISO3-F5]